jgi:hypothetical protein
MKTTSIRSVVFLALLIGLLTSEPAWSQGDTKSALAVSKVVDKKPSKRGVVILEKQSKRGELVPKKPSKRGVVIAEKPSKRGLVLEEKHKGSQRPRKSKKKP